MMVCTKCNGKGGTIGVESTIDVSGNTEGFHTSGGKPGAVVCSQCGGKGYY